MQTLHEFPFFPLAFDKAAHLVDPTQVSDLLTYLGQAATAATDLLVLSHGWNNDTAEASDRYDYLLRYLRACAPTGRRFVAVGVYWPSKKFANKELIPGGAAGLGNSAEAEGKLISELQALRGAFDAPDADALLDRAQALVPLLESQMDARTGFADVVKALMAGVHTAEAADHDGAAVIQQAPSDGLLRRLGEASPTTMEPLSDQADEGGAAAGLGDFLGGIKEGARDLFNYGTYYQMKERAGLVGKVGLRPVLAQVARQLPQLKLHLVGHSFGGRLVTSAASGQVDFRVQTMTLLQTAFSHYGFSNDYDGQGSAGLFRPLITDGTVTGPVLISHAKADVAVSRLYALASRMANQVGARLGGPDDKFGGLGGNGAQKTPEASFGALVAVPGIYAFQAGHLHNLHGNTVLDQKNGQDNVKREAIINGHGDICGPEIASAIMQAIATT